MNSHGKSGRSNSMPARKFDSKFDASVRRLGADHVPWIDARNIGGAVKPDRLPDRGRGSRNANVHLCHRRARHVGSLVAPPAASEALPGPCEQSLNCGIKIGHANVLSSRHRQQLDLAALLRVRGQIRLHGRRRGRIVWRARSRNRRRSLIVGRCDYEFQ